MKLRATAAMLPVPRAGDDISGEVAVVTGASRGLGLPLARELAGQFCSLVICARDAAELDRAASDLLRPGLACGGGAAGVPGQELTPAIGQKALSRPATLGRAAARRFSERPRQGSRQPGP